MMVVMLYIVVLVIVKISYVGTEWGCKDAQCQREPEDGSTPYRPGYHPLNYNEETPYVVAFEDNSNKEIFCLGVLINKDRALTTVVCVYIKGKGDNWNKREESSFSVLYGDKVVSRMQRQAPVSIRTHQRCNGLSITDTFWGSCDFAIVKTESYFRNARTATFPSLDGETVSEALELSKLGNRYCIGVGFGKYESWSGVDSIFGRWSWSYYRDGKAKSEMQKFDMRLLTGYTCNNQVKDCCITTFQKFIYFFATYFKRVNCVARGKKLSQCFGESGGPIICDGYVLGLVKGTLECKKTKAQNIQGFMIYVGLNHAVDFIRYDYIATYNSDTRPVPDLDPFGVPTDTEGRPVDPKSRPVLPPNMTGGDPRAGGGGGGGDGTGTGTDTESGSEGDDYYYGYGDIARPQILAVIWTIFILCYNLKNKT